MTRASTISAQLRRLGFAPMGSATRTSRPGLRVTQSGERVHVVADLDSERAAHDLAVAARTALIAAGYSVAATEYDAAFYVTRSS
jgi:hypothetical protein